MTPEQAQKIKKIKSNIATLEKQIPKIVDDKKKREKWVSDIASLKNSIDLIERQVSKTVNNNGQETTVTTLDFGAFKKDMEEHQTKVKALLKEITPLFPKDWEELLKSTCYSPIKANDLKKLQSLLVKAQSELNPWSNAINFYDNSFRKEGSRAFEKPIKGSRERGLIEQHREQLAENKALLEKMQQYADHYFTITDDKKEEKSEQKHDSINRELVIHHEKYKLIPSITGSIEWGSKVHEKINITSIDQHEKYTIPHDTSGTIKLELKQSFEFLGELTNYQETKSVSCSFSVDDKGVLTLGTLNSKSSSTSRDLVDVIFNKVSGMLDDESKKAKEKNPKFKLPEKAALDAIRTHLHKQSFNSSISVSKDGTNIKIELGLEVSDINVSIGADGSLEFKVGAGAAVGANGSVSFDMKGKKSSDTIGIELVAGKSPINVKSTGTIHFEEEGSFTLDNFDKKELHGWWASTQTALKTAIRNHVSNKKENKGKSKEAIDELVEEKLDEILYTKKNYLIKIQGFASSTGEDGDNYTLSNKRAEEIAAYLKDKVKVKGTIEVISPNGEEDCKKVYKDNSKEAKCKKGTITFKLK